MPETSCGSWAAASRRGHMFEQQSRLAVDQEDVLDAELDRVLEHHVGETAPAAKASRRHFSPCQEKLCLNA